jgi:hypothetical protein
LLAVVAVNREPVSKRIPVFYADFPVLRPIKRETGANRRILGNLASHKLLI